MSNADRADIGIKPIIVRQERSGIHMADAFSRLNSGQRVGVFCCQNGPGAENAWGANPLRKCPRHFAGEQSAEAPADY